jgi:hypothetical protein
LKKEKVKMKNQEELIQEYDNATAELFASLDAAHVALVNLRKVKQEISDQVSELGLIDSVGRDGPGKNLSKAVEASVIISVENYGTIHGNIEAARALLLGSSPDLAKLQAAGFTVEDWRAEWAQMQAVRG